MDLIYRVWWQEILVVRTILVFIFNIRPYVLELEANPLPSDCIFRSDVLYMKMKDLIKG